jgi:hypothetical protein
LLPAQHVTRNTQYLGNGGRTGGMRQGGCRATNIESTSYEPRATREDYATLSHPSTHEGEPDR